MNGKLSFIGGVILSALIATGASAHVFAHLDPEIARSHQPILSARSPENQPMRLDDGTGYYGMGTATGGPVGGLPNRN